MNDVAVTFAQSSIYGTWGCRDLFAYKISYLQISESSGQRYQDN